VRVSYDEGIASHIGHESCAARTSAEHKARGEALTMVHTGQVMSREIVSIWMPTFFSRRGRQHVASAQRRVLARSGVA
jgi:hypothetical protein